MASFFSRRRSPSQRTLAAGFAALTAPLAAMSLLSSCSSAPEPASFSSGAADPTPTAAAPAQLKVSVKEHLSMMPDAFTQGLEVDPHGNLLVGTGMYGQSRLMRLTPGSDSPEQEVALPDDRFGEGITQSGDSIWQLTWRAGEAIAYDATTFEKTGSARYDGEGWGLCSMDTDSGSELIMSDGSSQLRHLDPETFKETAPRTTVTLEGRPLEKLNELECVDGTVYANVWMSEDIMRIDPTSGQVTAVIDASRLNANGPSSIDDVLNGIAHIPGTNEYWITGKRWVDLYRVSFE